MQSDPGVIRTGAEQILVYRDRKLYVRKTIESHSYIYNV